MEHDSTTRSLVLRDGIAYPLGYVLTEEDHERHAQILAWLAAHNRRPAYRLRAIGAIVTRWDRLMFRWFGIRPYGFSRVPKGQRQQP
ncbi:MAG: hypothetical protein AUG49_18905 [Catenulispora sp. 13_1_20CM_3_70_7]|nr:MAG: hypothetical protein AUG49_18905 [Catenulispora sp. 13_1_20CM_3_70_7]